MSTSQDDEVPKTIEADINPNIGRRTGIDVKAGKNIRKDSKGIEFFEDYWTDSDEDSDSSFVTWKKQKQSVPKTVIAPTSQPKANIKTMSPFTPSFVDTSHQTKTLETPDIQSASQNIKPSTSRASETGDVIDEEEAFVPPSVRSPQKSNRVALDTTLPIIDTCDTIDYAAVKEVMVHRRVEHSAEQSDAIDAVLNMVDSTCQKDRDTLDVGAEVCVQDEDASNLGNASDNEILVANGVDDEMLKNVDDKIETVIEEHDLQLTEEHLVEEFVANKQEGEEKIILEIGNHSQTGVIIEEVIKDDDTDSEDSEEEMLPNDEQETRSYTEDTRNHENEKIVTNNVQLGNENIIHIEGDAIVTLAEDAEDSFAVIPVKDDYIGNDPAVGVEVPEIVQTALDAQVNKDDNVVQGKVHEANAASVPHEIRSDSGDNSVEKPPSTDTPQDGITKGLNNGGDVNGTITQIDSDKREIMLLKPASAVTSMRTKKRLTYSEALEREEEPSKGTKSSKEDGGFKKPVLPAPRVDVAKSGDENHVSSSTESTHQEVAEEPSSSTDAKSQNTGFITLNKISENNVQLCGNEANVDSQTVSEVLSSDSSSQEIENVSTSQCSVQSSSNLLPTSSQNSQGESSSDASSGSCTVTNSLTQSKVADESKVVESQNKQVSSSANQSFKIKENTHTEHNFTKTPSSSNEISESKKVSQHQQHEVPKSADISQSKNDIVKHSASSKTMDGIQKKNKNVSQNLKSKKPTPKIIPIEMQLEESDINIRKSSENKLKNVNAKKILTPKPKVKIIPTEMILEPELEIKISEKSDQNKSSKDKVTASCVSGLKKVHDTTSTSAPNLDIKKNTKVISPSKSTMESPETAMRADSDIVQEKDITITSHKFIKSSEKSSSDKQKKSIEKDTLCKGKTQKIINTEIDKSQNSEELTPQKLEKTSTERKVDNINVQTKKQKPGGKGSTKEQNLNVSTAHKKEITATKETVDAINAQKKNESQPPMKKNVANTSEGDRFTKKQSGKESDSQKGETNTQKKDDNINVHKKVINTAEGKESNNGQSIKELSSQKLETTNKKKEDNKSVQKKNESEPSSIKNVVKTPEKKSESETVNKKTNVTQCKNDKLASKQTYEVKSAQKHVEETISKKNESPVQKKNESDSSALKSVIKTSEKKSGNGTVTKKTKETTEASSTPENTKKSVEQQQKLQNKIKAGNSKNIGEKKTEESVLQVEKNNQKQNVTVKQAMQKEKEKHAIKDMEFSQTKKAEEKMPEARVDADAQNRTKLAESCHNKIEKTKCQIANDKSSTQKLKETVSQKSSAQAIEKRLEETEMVKNCVTGSKKSMATLKKKVDCVQNPVSNKDDHETNKPSDPIKTPQTRLRSNVKQKKSNSDNQDDTNISSGEIAEGNTNNSNKKLHKLEPTNIKKQSCHSKHDSVKPCLQNDNLVNDPKQSISAEATMRETNNEQPKQIDSNKSVETILTNDTLIEKSVNEKGKKSQNSDKTKKVAKSATESVLKKRDTTMQKKLDVKTSQEKSSPKTTHGNSEKVVPEKSTSPLTLNSETTIATIKKKTNTNQICGGDKHVTQSDSTEILQDHVKTAQNKSSCQDKEISEIANDKLAPSSTLENITRSSAVENTETGKLPPTEACNHASPIKTRTRGNSKQSGLENKGTDKTLPLQPASTETSEQSQHGESVQQMRLVDNSFQSPVIIQSSEAHRSHCDESNASSRNIFDALNIELSPKKDNTAIEMTSTQTAPAKRKLSQKLDEKEIAELAPFLHKSPRIAAKKSKETRKEVDTDNQKEKCAKNRSAKIAKVNKSSLDATVATQIVHSDTVSSPSTAVTRQCRVSLERLENSPLLESSLMAAFMKAGLDDSAMDVKEEKSNNTEEARDKGGTLNDASVGHGLSSTPQPLVLDVSDSSELAFATPIARVIGSVTLSPECRILNEKAGECTQDTISNESLTSGKKSQARKVKHNALHKPEVVEKCQKKIISSKLTRKKRGRPKKSTSNPAVIGQSQKVDISIQNTPKSAEISMSRRKGRRKRLLGSINNDNTDDVSSATSFSNKEPLVNKEIEAKNLCRIRNENQPSKSNDQAGTISKRVSARARARSKDNEPTEDCSKEQNTNKKCSNDSDNLNDDNRITNSPEITTNMIVEDEMVLHTSNTHISNNMKACEIISSDSVKDPAINITGQDESLNVSTPVLRKRIRNQDDQKTEDNPKEKQRKEATKRITRGRSKSQDADAPDAIEKKGQNNKGPKGPETADEKEQANEIQKSQSSKNTKTPIISSEEQQNSEEYCAIADAVINNESNGEINANVELAQQQTNLAVHEMAGKSNLRSKNNKQKLNDSPAPKVPGNAISDKLTDNVDPNEKCKVENKKGVMSNIEDTKEISSKVITGKRILRTRRKSQDDALVSQINDKNKQSKSTRRRSMSESDSRNLQALINADKESTIDENGKCKETEVDQGNSNKNKIMPVQNKLTKRSDTPVVQKHMMSPSESTLSEEIEENDSDMSEEIPVQRPKNYSPPGAIIISSPHPADSSIVSEAVLITRPSKKVLDSTRIPVSGNITQMSYAEEDPNVSAITPVSDATAGCLVNSFFTKTPAPLSKPPLVQRAKTSDSESDYEIQSNPAEDSLKVLHSKMPSARMASLKNDGKTDLKGNDVKGVIGKGKGVGKRSKVPEPEAIEKMNKDNTTNEMSIAEKIDLLTSDSDKNKNEQLIESQVERKLRRNGKNTSKPLPPKLTSETAIDQGAHSGNNTAEDADKDQQLQDLSISVTETPPTVTKRRSGRPQRISQDILPSLEEESEALEQYFSYDFQVHNQESPQSPLRKRAASASTTLSSDETPIKQKYIQSMADEANKKNELSRKHVTSKIRLSTEDETSLDNSNVSSIIVRRSQRARPVESETEENTDSDGTTSKNRQPRRSILKRTRASDAVEESPLTAPTLSKKRVSMAPLPPKDDTQLETPLARPRRSSTLPRASTSSPIHVFEMTETQPSTPITAPSPEPENKIIAPAIGEEEEGVRRSHRTRVKPLDWWQGEHIHYREDEDGLLVVDSIEKGPTVHLTKEQQHWKKRLQSKQLKKRQKKLEEQRNLTMHISPPEDVVENPASIAVIDPTSSEETVVDCVKTADTFNFQTPSGSEPDNLDPMLVCKTLRQKAFTLGQIILRPFEEKPTQFVRKDTMVFIVKKGKILVTIHKTKSILETDDNFFVPSGNFYSIKNLRNDEAKLWFFQHKHDQ